jgi:hypothetical protein
MTKSAKYQNMEKDVFELIFSLIVNGLQMGEFFFSPVSCDVSKTSMRATEIQTKVTRRHTTRKMTLCNVRVQANTRQKEIRNLFRIFLFIMVF